MILDEIVLHNFGVYSGRQPITLTPPSPKKPVVLFGGMNGGGKTTLLDGMHLALYGKRARCSNRGSLAYEEFLRRAIHRQARPDEGAAVEVSFRHRNEGKEHAYRVQRSWSKSEGGAREKLEVIKDGKLDRVLTDGWNEQVEEFLPLGLSQLFLFDGEKIESLADLENSAQLLGTAINSLLGLEIVGQLGSDLSTLERRKKALVRNDVERSQIDTLQAEVNALDESIAAAMQACAAAKNDLDQATKKFRKIEDRFQREGGDLFEQRSALDAERSRLEGEVKAHEESIRELAAGSAPLLLLQPLLSFIDEQAQAEERQAHAAALEGVLEERDAKVVESLTGAFRADLVRRVEALLRTDREARIIPGSARQFLDVGKEARDLLAGLRTEGFPIVERDATRLLEQLDLTRQRFVDIERKLSGIPDESAIAALVKQRDEARAAVTAAQLQVTSLEEQLTAVRARRGQAHDRLGAALEKAVEGDLARDDTSRLLTHSVRVRGTLGRFHEAVVETHVRRIATLVLDCFRRLLRKQGLVASLEICPKTYRVELKSSDGRRIEQDRLSAGERQLLAVALLWGLARASGRPLPSIIDTPLGRLDSSHRSHLVERYFPYASHQVLLLSTDEEIDTEQFNRLKPFIGLKYRLDFDDGRNATHVEPGYFWS